MTHLPEPGADAVVFDVGGVLLDWDPRHLYRGLFADEEAMEHFLATVCTPAWNRRQDAGRSWAEAVAELTARFPEHSALIAAYDERWPEMVAGPLHETVELLAAVRDAGHRLLALTNFSTEKFAEARRRFPFLGWFEGVVVSGEVGLVKPDPRIYRHLVETFRLTPARTLFVDDTAANVEAAAAAGLRAVHFTGAAALRDPLVGFGLLPPTPA